MGCKKNQEAKSFNFFKNENDCQNKRSDDKERKPSTSPSSSEEIRGTNMSMLWGV